MRDLLQTFVMAAFEKGYLQDPPILRDPLGDMKQLSLDLELDWKVTLLDGRRVDAVKDILIGYYLKRIETMLEREKACDEDWTAFTRLSQLLGVVAERDLSRLAYCLDWVTKFGLVQACEDTNEGLAACNQFCLIDGSILNYTGEKDPTQGDSLFEPKESISKMLNWVPEATPEKIQDDVRQSRFRPPASTRESKRVQALVEKSSEDLEANWSFVAGKQGWERNFPDPLG